jgi:lipid-binding SYLF domain-containing protein
MIHVKGTGGDLRKAGAATRNQGGDMSIFIETGLPRRKLLRLIPLSIGAVGLAATTARANGSEISADSWRALEHLYTTQPKTKLLGQKAVAILVFPKITKGGLVVAGQRGEGALLQNGKTVGYYSITGASVGLQIGAQTFSHAMFFMNQKALANLRNSSGWSVGSGASVAALDSGGAAGLSSDTINKDVYAISFGASGLMAALDLGGSKISPIHPS